MTGAPEVRTARDVADLRTHLVGELRRGAPLGQILEEVADRAQREGRQPPTDRGCEHRLMAEADLYYVPADAIDAITEAAASVPDDLILSEWQMPSPAGFAVFEKAMEGIDADGTDQPVIVHAILWGCVNIWDQRDMAGYVCIGISNWQLWQDQWLPLGRSDWIIGTNVTSFPLIYNEIGGAMKASAREDRQRLAALWGLCLALPEQHEPAQRQVHRRALRAGVKGGSGVRVLNLPSPVYRGGIEQTGRHQRVRSYVRGFWRRQPCGPGRTERRWVYVHGFWRGPVNAPLSSPTTVVKRLVT